MNLNDKIIQIYVSRKYYGCNKLKNWNILYDY